LIAKKSFLSNKNIVMIYRLSIFYFLLLSAAPEMSAQNYLLPERTKFNRAYIKEPDKNLYHVANLVIDGDSLRFYNSSTLQREVIGIPDVHYMRLLIGTRAGRGAAMGAAVAGSALLFAIIRISSDPNLVFRDNTGARSIAIVGVGAGIGALIGSMSPKWETFYPNILSGSGQIWKPEFFIPNSYPGLGLRFHLN